MAQRMVRCIKLAGRPSLQSAPASMTTFMCREPDTLPEESSTCLIEQPPEQGGLHLVYALPTLRSLNVCRVQGPAVDETVRYTIAFLGNQGQVERNSLSKANSQYYL